MSLISFLILGLIAGWLAETTMKGRGAGLVVNLLLGVIGAYLGGFFQPVWFVGPRFYWIVDHCYCWGVVLLFLINFLKKP